MNKNILLLLIIAVIIITGAIYFSLPAKNEISTEEWLANQIPVTSTKALPSLPLAMANNATALITNDAGVTLYSFKGLEQGKTWRDTSLKAFALTAGADKWRTLSPVPDDLGQLAATAVGLKGKIYIFGGYTVGEDHSEVSVNTSYEYDPQTDAYQLIPEIPVAVDDAVSFTVGDRYIYLISGWHNSGNVNLSQVYDTVEKKWSQATPYPGSAVFGHAGAAVGSRFVICDGVEKIVPLEGRHQYQAVGACFRGQVDPAKPLAIRWQRIAPHPGKPLYRMASGGYGGTQDWIIFVGGTDNPYNYDGMGYDGQPSKPSDLVMAYALDSGTWHQLGRLDRASMDHRSLLVSEGRFFIVGGMVGDQKVTDKVVEFCLKDSEWGLSPCDP